MPEEDENAVDEREIGDAEPNGAGEPRALLDGADVPQTDDLGRIRAVVDAVVARASSTDEVARAVGLSSRHAAYAIRAAVTLELVDRALGPLTLTPAGHSLARTVPGSAEEATRLRDAVLCCPAVQAIAPNLLGRRGPSRAVIARRIAKLATMAPATADRRAQTLLSWRRQLRGERRAGTSVSSASAVGIPSVVEALLWDGNPWWRAEQVASAPATRRGLFAELAAAVDGCLAPAVLLRGPRQAGKSTLLAQLVERELGAGVDPKRIVRVVLGGPADLRKLRTPLLSAVRWYADRVLGCSLHQAAAGQRPVLCVIDRAHEHADWAAELRHLVDSSPVRVVLAGDGAMTVPSGQYDPAGQVRTVEVPLLSLPDVATLRGLGRLAPWLAAGTIERLGEPTGWLELVEHGEQSRPTREAAFAAFLERGGYPVAHTRSEASLPLVREQLRESVVERALLHDCLVGAAGERVERTALARVLDLVCAHAGRSLAAALARAAQRDDFLSALGSRRTRALVEELAASLLVRLVEPAIVQAEPRRMGAMVCVADHVLADVWLRRPRALGSFASVEAGGDAALGAARSLVGSYLASLPGTELVAVDGGAVDAAVDFVLRVGEVAVPIVVSPGPIALSTAASRALCHLDARRSAARFAVVVAVPHIEPSVADPPTAASIEHADAPSLADGRLVFVPLSTLLTLR